MILGWALNNMVLPYAEPDRFSGLGRRLQRFDRFEQLSRKEQLEEQQRRVRALLDHAYLTTPYWRRVFDEAGFRASDWRSGDALPLPQTTDQILRDHAADLKSRKAPHADARAIPTMANEAAAPPLICDIEGLQEKNALQFHLEVLSGYRPGIPSVLVHPVQSRERDPSSISRFCEKYLLRRHTVPSADTSGLIGLIKQVQPEIVMGDPFTLVGAARQIRTGELRSPTRVITQGAPLADSDRSAIEAAFHCGVVEHYSPAAIGTIARQCEDGGRYHFHPLGCFVELIYSSESAQGPVYRLLVTDLMNYAMPLVRFETEDCVVYDRSPCPCGSWQPSVKTILRHRAVQPCWKVQA